ncbi:MAG: DUF3379 family protein [Gammaproteobacteria bacterium]
MGKPDPTDRAERARIAADAAAFEALLARAAQLPRQAPATRRPRGHRHWVQFGLAASLVLATALWFGLREPASLPEAVIAHVHHEPEALAPARNPVNGADLEQVLRQAGAEFVRPVGTVTYVKLCPFRGEMVAHFVVQGRRGPVTVLLLPEENISTPAPIREDGFVGTLVPLEIGGSIAVVGEPEESLETIRDALVAALRWRV